MLKGESAQSHNIVGTVHPMHWNWAPGKNCKLLTTFTTRLTTHSYSCIMDPLVYHGHHFGHTVHTLCNIHTLLTNGILQLVELANRPAESFTAKSVSFCPQTWLSCSYWRYPTREHHEHDVFLLLLQSVPGLEEHLLNGSKEDFTHIGELICPSL